MRLLNFKAKNLFSLGEIDLDLSNRGLLLVTGHSLDEGGANGSGKSSISNKGILWTLFGSTASGDKADAAINRFAEEDATCCGSLDVESNDGSKFRIIRSRNPNRLTIIDVASGEDVSAKTEKDTQELVHRILGRTRDTFLQTDFFGQGKAANFLDLTPKAQVEVLEEILPIDQVNQLAESAKKNLAKINVIITSINRQISEVTGKLLEAQKSERTLSTSVDEWEAQHYARLATLREKITQEEASDQTLSTIAAIRAKIADLPSRSTLEEDLATAKENEKSYLVGLTSWRESLQAWVNEKSKIVAVPKPVSPKACPTCKSKMSDETFQVLQHRYNEYTDTLKKYDRQITEINNEIQRLDSFYQTIKNYLTKVQNQLDTLTSLEYQIEQINNSRNSNRLSGLKQELELVEAEINPYTAMYSESTKNVNSLVSNLTHQKSRLEEVEKDKAALEFWQAAFSKDLKNEMLNLACPFLQEKAKIHLEGLGNGQIKVQVSTTKTLKSNENRSEFSVTVFSTTGGATYDSLSGGEKQMANFAVGLALADLAELQVDGPSRFMVLDEPFTMLDARNSENLVSYLNSYLADKKETILLVSNEESLKALVPNRIHVVKENGVTRLESP